jgi:hypothetical protein
MRGGSSACRPNDLTMGIASASMAAADEQGQGQGRHRCGGDEQAVAAAAAVAADARRPCATAGATPITSLGLAALSLRSP